MKLPRLFYTLPELATELGVTETELLQMAAAGELELSVYHYSAGLRTRLYRGHKAIVDYVQLSGYVQLSPWQVESILNHGFEKTILTHVSMDGDRVDLRSEGALHRFKVATAEKLTEGYNVELPIGFDARPVEVKSSTKLLVLPDEVARKFPKLAGRNAAAVEVVSPARQSGLPPLDPMQAIPGGWKGIAGELGKSPDYAKKYCKNNGIRVEHDNAGKPWTTREEIARSRLTK